MIGLLKMFGKGILYVIGFPFFVAALLIFGAIGIFLFAFQLIKSIFYFFTGRKFFPELPEDQELRLMKAKAAAGTSEEYTTQSQNNEEPTGSANTYQTYMSPVMNEQPEPAPQPAPVIEETPTQSSIERAVFLDLGNDVTLKPLGSNPEPQVEPEDEQVQESPFEDLVEEEAPIEEEPQPEPESEPVEEVPMEAETIETSLEEAKFEEEEHLDEYVPKGSSVVDDYEDEEDTNSGVSIDYDL